MIAWKEHGVVHGEYRLHYNNMKHIKTPYSAIKIFIVIFRHKLCEYNKLF